MKLAVNTRWAGRARPSRCIHGNGASLRFCPAAPSVDRAALIPTASLLAFAFLLANLQWLSGPPQRAVASHLHREFKIGAMHLRWGGHPTFELNDVVLGNLPGGSEPQMARVRSVRMRLSLFDLLRGRISPAVR